MDAHELIARLEKASESIQRSAEIIRGAKSAALKKPIDSALANTLKGSSRIEHHNSPLLKFRSDLRKKI